MSFGTGARLSLVGGLAALGAALALLLSAGHASGADPMKMNMNMSMSKTGASAKAVKLRLGMNKLWEDHVTWTRMVIVDFAANLPDLQTAEGRLLRNQADIGNAIKPYYGAAAGKKLTSLLRTHILEAVPVLQDAKAGDNAKLQRDLAKWYANAHQIAVFLSMANPHNWPLKGDGQDDEAPPPADHRRGGRTAQGQLERGRQGVRPRPRRDPADGRHAQHRDHQAVPEPLLSSPAAAALAQAGAAADPLSARSSPRERQRPQRPRAPRV